MPNPLPPSLYAETARPGIAAPPLDGDKQVSVAIIGGGFTGLSAALHLAERGTDVAVLEANEPGWGASGRNGGQVNPGLKFDPDQIEADFGPELGRRMVVFSSDAPNLVFDLTRTHQISCEGRQGGTLRAAYATKTADAVRRTAEQYLRRGMPVELLEHAAIRQLTGSDRYLAAMLDRRGGSLNPLGYARGLADAASRAGAAIHAATPALKVARASAPTARRWAIQTPGGTLHAQHLVIATNGYTDDLWPRLRRSIVPLFSGIVASEPLPAATAAAILPDGAALYEHGLLTVYYRIDTAGRLLIGGRSPMRDGVGFDSLRWLIRYTARLWPKLRDVRWTHVWNGQLALTQDHYPHLHEPDPAALICLGYNGRGVAMATAMGSEIARRVLGGNPAELNMPITNLKQIPFHGLWKTAAAARITYGRVRDRLGIWRPP